MRNWFRVAAFAVALALALGVGAVPANAQDPPPPPPICEGEWVGGFCVSDPLPYTRVETPPPPPIDQVDTGDSDTGALAEGEEATGYDCNGLRQSEWTFSVSPTLSYIVQARVCTENLPGGWTRGKQRITFFGEDPSGRFNAYGNVRWDTKWVDPTNGPPKRYLMRGNEFGGWELLAGTKNRADAIQVHSTVGYSNAGCHLTSGYRYGTMRHHYVRLPNGVLAGPFSKAGAAWWESTSCPT